MYIPKQFREERSDVLVAAMRDIQFCTLVTAHAGGIEATHVPVVLAEHGETITLECHVARGNPHWRVADGSSETLAIFQGPHAYISPSWYWSKEEHGKVVPTWNYVVVHARGRLVTFDDGNEVLAHVTRLTEQNESGRNAPWAVSDAPADYLDTMRKAIVGMRMTIERLEGSWKLIQHKPEPDRLGTMAGLSGEATENARRIATLMRAAEEARKG
jgi:transcriptional regulator